MEVEDSAADQARKPSSPGAQQAGQNREAYRRPSSGSPATWPNPEAEFLEDEDDSLWQAVPFYLPIEFRTFNESGREMELEQTAVVNLEVAWLERPSVEQSRRGEETELEDTDLPPSPAMEVEIETETETNTKKKKVNKKEGEEQHKKKKGKKKEGEEQDKRKKGKKEKKEVEKHHSVEMLPSTICTDGRRPLDLSPELLAMLRLAFESDIRKKRIQTSRIVKTLRENPVLLSMCKKAQLSIENVRSRLRLMVKEQ